MKVSFNHYLQVAAGFSAAVLLLVFNIAKADNFSGLGVTGVAAASTLATWPVDSKYSWIKWVYPGATFAISWRLHPGTDGGVLFFNGQPPESLTAEFLMLNLDTTIYSVNNGITIDGSETIDMSNLRRKFGNEIQDLGSGINIDPQVPLVGDVTALTGDENGWHLNVDGTYHVLYNAPFDCDQCKIVIHFYGNQIPITADGDINRDGKIDVADILLAQRNFLGLASLTVGQLAKGDVYPPGQGDGELTLSDLLLITKLSVLD